MLSAAKYRAQDKRPNFVNYTPQSMLLQHRKQVTKGFNGAVVDARYININFLGLNTLTNDKGKSRNFPSTKISGQNFSVQLPGINYPVLLTVDSIQNLIDCKNITTYVGHVSDDAADKFVLSVSDKIVMGNINYGKFNYVISPIGRSLRHTVVQIDKSLMVKDTSEDVREFNNIKTSQNTVTKSSNGSGHVEVLFYAASDIYWPSYQVSNVVAYTNGVLIDSGIPTNNYISSVGIKVIKTTLSGLCKNPIADQIENRQGKFSDLDADLTFYGADMMFLLVSTQENLDCSGWPNGDFVPWGRRGGVAARFIKAHPYALSTHTYAVNDLTAVHEIGHVFNGGHNVSSATAGNNRGLTGPSGNWQTIMGGYEGDNGCYFSLDLNNMDCERIGKFSNPSKSYNGITIGSSSRNMTSYLQTTSMPIVSGWRSPPVPIPSAPNPISSNNELCFGLNTVTWTAQSSATSYKLFKSTSSSFTSPTLLYSGTNTTTGVIVDSGTWYLRAQACNSSACSSYSNQVSAYRISSCL